MGMLSAWLLLSILASSSSACPHGPCGLLDKCSSDQDCGDGLYCFYCVRGFSSSKCVRSAPTELLNNSLPFNKYAYLTTHNAFAIDGYPSRTGIPRLTVTNQEDSVTQQLKNGVRALMLDTYDFRQDVWLCHSFGEHCYDYTAFGPAVETLKEIEAFLSANPSEIVTIILEDYVKAPKGLTKVFTAAGLMKYWFPLASMPKKTGTGVCTRGNVRTEGSWLHFQTSKSLVLVNYFRSFAMKELTCIDNSGELIDMVNTCYNAAGNRWANSVAVNYYKRSQGEGSFQAVDKLNGKLMCGCNDIHACLGGSRSAGCSAQDMLQ